MAVGFVLSTVKEAVMREKPRLREAAEEAELILRHKCRSD
jgi:hypothetical protein